MNKILPVLVFLFAGISPILHAQVLDGSFDSKFTRYQPGQSFQGTAKQTWTDVAWKGERLSTQLVLWNTSATAFSALGYEVTDLTGGTQTIGAANLRLRFAGYAKGDPEGRACSEYSTRASQALYQFTDPLSATPVATLTNGEPLKIWVSLDVPQTAAAGTYTGSIRIKNNGTVVKTFALSFQVVDKTLAAPGQWAFHLDLWQYPYQLLYYYNQSHPSSAITAWSPQHLALLKPGYRLLAGAGQKAITAHIKDQALGGPSMVKWTRKADGTWSYDFTAFTNYVRFMQDSIGISTQINCFSLIGWNENEIPYWDEASNSAQTLAAPVGSTDFTTRWNAFLTAFKTYLDTQGWFSKTVLFMDEIADDKMLQVVNLIKANNAGWKIGVSHVKQLSSDVVNQLYDKSGSLALASGHTNSVSTFYTSCSEVVPNNYLTATNNPAEMTWMPWHAQKDGLDGYLRWGYDYWYSSDPYEMRNGQNTAGDYAMIYRSSYDLNAETQSSIRFELLREGIQDFEKIRTLKTLLAASGTAYDQESLTMLNAKVNEFSKYSGTGAAALVTQGQQLLKDIVTGKAGYCQAGGGAYTSYYFSSVTSSGGTTNLSYSRSSFPATGYEHHTASALSARAGTSLSLQIGSSTASACARMAVWVDWNNDLDFDDAGEQVYTGGAAQSCTNPTSNTATFSVPAGFGQGKRRMRMQVKDAWLGVPVACGISNYTCTVDMDLTILDTYCPPRTAYNSSDYYVSGFETTNACNGNVQYKQTYSPSGGYAAPSAAPIRVNQGAAFGVTLTNSASASCTRTKVWADWNRDGDFSDAGEEVFSAGDSATCNNLTSYRFFISVPGTASIGLTRLRVQLRDAWSARPDPCLLDGVAGTTDLDLEVTSGLPACAPMLVSPANGSRLTSASPLFTWVSNGTSPISQWALTASWQQDGMTTTSSRVLTGGTFSSTLDNLPTDGRPVTVSLSSGSQSATANYLAADTYCTVRGGAYKGYFIQHLETAGALTNAQYNRDKCPDNGYERVTDSGVAAYQGSSFNLILKTSWASNTAITKVWIDWNGNSSFADANELVFTGGTAQSIANARDYSISVNVPATAAVGSRRMRIQVYDAWQNAILCGVQNTTATVDFSMTIQTAPQLVSATSCTGTATAVGGTVIGSTGSYDGYSTRDKVFDNDNNTWFDAIQANGQWAGLDLGTEKKITCLIFRPRNGWGSRMPGGKFQISTDAAFTNPVTLYTIPSGASLTFTDYVLTSSDPAGIKARYVRYLSPDNGWGNIAEIRVFANEPAPVYAFVSAGSCGGSTTQLTGTVIGSTGSYDGTSTRDKVFDGDYNTYFDAAQGNGQWAGLDLGSNRTISCLVFRPRNGWGNRMAGGQFQVSSDAAFTSPVTLYAIPLNTSPAFSDNYLTSSVTGGVTARYVRYLSPDGGWGNIAELKVYSAYSSSRESVAGKPDSAVLYPNPTTGTVRLKNWKEAVRSVRIYSASGTEWPIPQIGAGNVLDVSRLPAGSYVVLVNEQVRLPLIKL